MSMELREEARRREREQNRIRQSRERFALDLRAVASQPEGARLLRRLIREGDLFRPDFQPGPAGAYRAGKKAAALELWRALRECLPRDVFVDIALEADGDGEGHAAALPETYPDDDRFDFEQHQ